MEMKMDIFKCERIAKDIGFNKAKFTAFFPSGPIECQWLDAYMGIFKIDADWLKDTFVMTRQINEMFPDLECSEPYCDSDNLK